MRIAFAFAAVLLAGSACGAESAYSRIDLDRDCREVSSYEAGGSYLCTGYKGVPIHFAEGDLRQSAFYGEVGPWFDKGAFESFGPFNHAGPTVEWRLVRGAPVATIRRWFLSAGEDGAKELEVLVVSRVGQSGEGEACVAGYVEATRNPDANLQARAVADNIAPTFPCRRAEPQWHGPRRYAIEPMRTFGE